MKFDVQAARTAGYSDDEIAVHLAKQAGFDLAGASKSGYSTTEILDHLVPPPVAEKKRTWGEAATDTGRSLLAGGAGLVKSAGDLYGLATGNMGNAASTLGADGQQYWEDGQSDVLKGKKANRQAAIDAETGVAGKAWEAVKSTVTDPALALDTVASNAATMLPGAAVGRVAAGAKYASGLNAASKAGPASLAAREAAAKAAGTLGTAASIGTGAVQQGADVSADAYAAAMAKPDEAWITNREFMDRVRKTDRSALAIQSLKEEFALKAARMTMPAATAISVAANAIPGATMLERALVGGAARDTIKAGAKFATPKAMAKAALGEGAQEAAEEGGGAYAGNIAKQAYIDPNQDVYEKVGENAGMGIAGGLLMGGAGGAFHRVDRSTPAAPAVSGTAPVPPVAPAAPAAPTVQNFSNPLGPAAQAGITPVLVPTSTVIPTAGNPNVSASPTAGGLAALNGDAAGFDAGAGLADAGPAAVNPSEFAALPAGIDALNSQNDMAVRGNAGLTAPIDEQPAATMQARSGKGYATTGDAKVALKIAGQRQPDLSWRIEPIEGGRFRIAGYTSPQAKETPTDVPQPAKTPEETSPAPGAQAAQEKPAAVVNADPFYQQAVDVVLKNQKASISLVQRHLQIGYSRAARLVEDMEKDGLVSPMKGDGSRSILKEAIQDPPTTANIAGAPINKEWTAFSPESGTKSIPRAEMPQIKAEHRGAMVNFLNARGIAHEQVEIPAGDLKPTQAEFSPAKVELAKAFEGGDRSILVSADGHVLDGHHQWLAKMDAGETVKAIRLDAPIGKLLEQVKEFPSVQASAGATEMPAHLGRNNIPLTEGGKPFKMRMQADMAKKLQPQMRVVKVAGGFALADKTPAQLEAQAKAARRMAQPNTSPAGQPIPAHAFIAAEGGMHQDARSDLGVQGNPRIGNRTLYAGQGKGLSLEQATEKLVQGGYLREGVSHSDTLALVKRSLTNPQYTAEGTERMAEADKQTKFEAQQAEQEAVADVESVDDAPFEYVADLDPNDDNVPFELTATSKNSLEADMRSMGFTQEEINEALANESGAPQADRQDGGVAVEANARGTQAGTGQRNEAPGADQAGRGQDEGLTAPTRADILAQQDQADAGEKATKAQRRADDERARKEQERKDIAARSQAAADTFELGGDAEQNLTGQGNIFSQPEQAQQAQAAIKKVADKAEGRIDYAADFAIRSIEISESLMTRGVIKALYKAAGVKTADAFDALPMESRGNAYAKFVRDGGAPEPAATESYNDKVAFKEREAVVRRLQSDQEVNQANGKPFKTEESAKRFSAEFDLNDTHKSTPNGVGYTLRRLGEGQRPSVRGTIAARKASDPIEVRQDAAWAKADAIGPAANSAILAYENGNTSLEEFERALAAIEKVASKPAKTPSAAELRAQADLKAALADLGDIFGRSTRLNMMPEQEAKILPVMVKLFDAAFRLGYHKFKDAAKFALDKIRAALGDDVADDITLEHLQGAYISMSSGKMGVDGIRAVSNIESKSEIEAHTAQTDNERTGESDVPSPDSRVERDSAQPAAEPAVGDTVSLDAARAGAATAEAGGRTDRETGGRQQDGAGVPFGSAPVARERGDQRVSGGIGQPEFESIVTGTDFREPGGDSGITGVPVDPIPASDVVAAADQGVTGLKAAIESNRAAKAPAQAGNLANITATLPQLLPGQHADVQMAEQRFAKPDGYGMLFTNGTGTGKTFSGLGIVKRFAMQGKNNTLITVPDNKIASDWIASGKLLGLNINELADTKDAGKGIVVTTYANLGENDQLAARAWDLVVADEAHTLMQSADGVATGYLDNLRAITMHPDGVNQRHSMLHRELLDQISALREESKALGQLTGTSAPEDHAKAKNIQRRMDALMVKMRETQDAIKADVAAKQGAARPRLVALSATPFAYEKTIDWANGYLFDYNDGQPSEEGVSRGYNAGDNRERYFMQHFGYTMRYNKLTQPDAKVDRGMMQRQWNGQLKKAGVLSGRMLDVKPDYDRRFILVNSAIGNRIDEALQWVSDQRQAAGKGENGYSLLGEAINDKFKYLEKRYLLEAIKATEVVPIVKQHMAMGRKVVVFHDYKKGGGFNPFQVTGSDPKLRAAVAAFNAQFADLVRMPLGSMPSPIEVFKREIPEVLLVNGDEKQKDLLARYKSFQDDSTGPQVMLVQSAKNKGWSGHDTTGKHQRVLINLGQPTAPTLAIQQEGRIYRTGQASDAIMRYMNTGTNWERWTFATTIASRASTAENLGMGEMARALKDSFIQSFEESDTYAPGHEDEGKGGKARDQAANNAVTEYDRAKTMYWATQKKNSRTKAQEGADYFATPEPLGLKMVQWLDARSGEDTLEPSGGHGAIARWLPDTTKRTVVEPSLALRSRLAMVMNPTEDRIIAGTFEDLGVVNKYDGIVMNPPFGTAGRTAVDHIAKAATHLRDGGRIVALLPTGPAADKKFEQWFYEKSDRPVRPLFTHPTLGAIYKGDTITTRAPGSPSGVVEGFKPENMAARQPANVMLKVPGRPGTTGIWVDLLMAKESTGKRMEEYSPAADLHLVANITLPQVTFERAGTAVATRIVVIEKQSDKAASPIMQRNRDLSSIADINELFNSLEDITFPARAKAVEAAPVETPKAEKPAKATAAPKAATGDLISLGGRETYEVTTYTTNGGKELRGVWVPTKAMALQHGPSTFEKKGLGFFVRERDFPKVDGPSFSRADETATTGLPTTAVQQAVDALSAKWANSPDVVVINDLQDPKVPERVRAHDEKQRSQGASGDPEGFFYGGKVYLLASQLHNEADVSRVLFHEALGHFGLRGVFGDSLKPMLDQISLGRRSEVAKKAAEYGLDMSNEKQRREAAEEVLAELAQTHPELGVVKRAIAAIRTWLREHVPGFNTLRVSDSEILRNYILPARAWVERSQQAEAQGLPAFSRSKIIGQTSRHSWDAPEASKFDDLVYKLQDKQIDSKRVMEAIRATSKGLADEKDVYLQEELFHGRAAARTEDFVNKELGPLITEMKMRGIDIPMLDEYLHARHAEEANKLIADRNPEIQDGGSGMMTQAARDYLSNLDPTERKRLDAAAAKVDAILAGTRQLYADYSLESDDTVKGWGTMFKHYVPLMREDKDGGMGIGQGFSIKGKETKGRTGSTRKVVDILANIAMQRERAIVRGEKNRVAAALVGLVKSSPNADFWQAGPPPMEKVYDPKSNSVVERADPMYKSRDNVVMAKIKQADGTVTEQAVTFNEDNERALRMAVALKNLDAAQLEGLLGASAKITRYFAAINTQWNPIFGTVNLVRDFQGALLNLSATQLKGHGKEIAVHTLSALKGIYLDTRAARDGKMPNSKWAQLWGEFQDEGGQTGFRDMFSNSADRAKAIEHELNPTAWMDSPLGKVFTANGALRVPLELAQKRATGLFGWLSDYNLAMENAVRLATYKVALEQGMSKQQAASLGKNLTVNFNRRGQVGQQAGAVYAFFNASMQGSARIGKTLFDMDGSDVGSIRLSDTGKKIVYGGILLGTLQALLLAAAGFDDEEPPDFVRERSLIIPTGGNGYITIPMPLGLHVIPNMGRIPTEFVLGGFKNPVQHITKLLGLVAGAFNPIGGGASLVQMLSPTAVDPLVALAENKDWTGKPIAKTAYNKAIPGHALAKDTASYPAKLLAEAFNTMSGGTKYTAGVLSPTPDQIDYLWGQATGGVGRELSKVQQSLSAGVSGEDLPIHKIPLVGRFYGNSETQSAQSSKFYSTINLLNEHEAEIKGLRKDGKGAEAAQYMRDNPESRLFMSANAAEQEIQKLHGRKRELIARNAPAEQVRAVELMISERMARFNSVVQQLSKKQAA